MPLTLLPGTLRTHVHQSAEWKGVIALRHGMPGRRMVCERRLSKVGHRMCEEVGGRVAHDQRPVRPPIYFPVCWPHSCRAARAHLLLEAVSPLCVRSTHLATAVRDATTRGVLESCLLDVRQRCGCIER